MCISRLIADNGCAMRVDEQSIPKPNCNERKYLNKGVIYNPRMSRGGCYRVAYYIEYTFNFLFFLKYFFYILFLCIFAYHQFQTKIPHQEKKGFNEVRLLRLILLLYFIILYITDNAIHFNQRGRSQQKYDQKNHGLVSFFERFWENSKKLGRGIRFFPFQ